MHLEAHSGHIDTVQPITTTVCCPWKERLILTRLNYCGGTKRKWAGPEVGDRLEEVGGWRLVQNISTRLVSVMTVRRV